VLTILYFELLVIPENIRLLNNGEIGIISHTNVILLYLTVAYFASGFLIFKKLIYHDLPNKIVFLFSLISIVLFVGYFILLVIYTQTDIGIFHNLRISLVSIENRVGVSIVDLRKMNLLVGIIYGISKARTKS